MKVRAVYLDDGSVAVIRQAPGSPRTFKESCEKAVKDQDDLYGMPYDDIDDSELPATRKYRDAWTGSKGNGITIDSTKKAEIDAERAKPTDKERIEALEAVVAELEKN